VTGANQGGTFAEVAQESSATWAYEIGESSAGEQDSRKRRDIDYGGWWTLSFPTKASLQEHPEAWGEGRGRDGKFGTLS